MIAATVPVHHRADARVLGVDRTGAIRHLPRARLVELFRPGDVVIANDAATIPASLHGVHEPTGRAIEVRLAGRASLHRGDITDVMAVIFGEGDFRLRTEDRPLPPAVTPGDRLRFGPLTARVVATVDHPRLLRLHFEGAIADIWAGLARHGKPIQYSHLSEPLALWDSWTPIAGPPVAFEPPSAGFVLTWGLIEQFAARDIRFATLTHAAGISSTGDPLLDARLPFDEAYCVPAATARLIEEAQSEGQRIVAVGTSVVRALESAAGNGGRVTAGGGIATGRLGADSRLRVVNAIVSGTHEPDTSHYELLRAFVPDPTLAEVDLELNGHHYRTHEFGDSVFIERNLHTALRV